MAQRRVVVRDEAEHGDEHEEQREHREEAVVRDQRGEVPAAVVAVLLDHADDERRRPVPLLPRGRPDRHAAVDHLHGRCSSRRSRRATTCVTRWCSNARMPLRRATARSRDRSRSRPRAGRPFHGERWLVVGRHGQPAVSPEQSAWCRRAGTPSARCTASTACATSSSSWNSPTPGPSNPGVYTHASSCRPDGTGTSLSTRALVAGAVEHEHERARRARTARGRRSSRPSRRGSPAASASGTSTSATMRKPPNRRATESSGTGPPSGRYTARVGTALGHGIDRGDATDELVDEREHLVALGLRPTTAPAGRRARRDARRRRRGVSAKSSGRRNSAHSSSANVATALDQTLLVDHALRHVVGGRLPAVGDDRTRPEHLEVLHRRAATARDASVNVARIDAPSTGCCATPSTAVGRIDAGASSTVGMRSTACTNWSRTAPPPAMPRGQCTISGVRVPPSHV